MVLIRGKRLNKDPKPDPYTGIETGLFGVFKGKDRLTKHFVDKM